MITLTARDTVRHESGGVTYHLAIPTLREKAAWRRDLSAAGAVLYLDGAMLECLRDGVNICVTESQRPELLEIIDQYEYETRKRNEESVTDKEKSYDELLDQLGQIEDFVRTNYERYSRMEASRQYWFELAPILAFQRFVKGWEGMELQYKAHNGLVDESLVDKIDPSMISDVGYKIINLMQPNKDEEKNSESQSS